MTDNVIRFPGHKREWCRNAECTGCVVCNLFLCATCDGAEASLPTHCPGERMYCVQSDGVQDGSLDYKDGTWVFKCRDAPMVLEFGP